MLCSANKYDLKGDLNEQCRDAIKSGDASGVKLLIGNGADAKFCDRTGNTFLHLVLAIHVMDSLSLVDGCSQLQLQAAMFNHIEIVTFLISKGADIWSASAHRCSEFQSV